MRLPAFVICAMLLVSAQAPGDAVMSHYRAYAAALAAGDLNRAESEAHDALQASQARDQRGGRTGVLALNLARVRLANDHRAEAYEPAALALDIARNTPDSRVDSLLARLTLGRAELSDQHQEDGRALLLQALSEARTRPDFGADAYEAALDLSNWTLSRELFEESAAAWAYAAEYSPFASGDQRLALGEARTAQGAALISLAVANELRTQRRGQGLTGSILPGPDQRDAYRSAQTALLEAERVLLPMAMVRGEGDGLTVAQRDYALARAWRGIIATRLSSNELRVIEAPDEEDIEIPGGKPACPVRVNTEPGPTYPRSALEGVTFQVGVVVLRIHTDEAGAADIRVAGAVPREPFQSAVERVASRWTVERLPGGAPDCRIPPVVFTSVTFRVL